MIAAGKLSESMVGAFSEFGRRLIAERVKDGLAYAKSHGTRSGRPVGRPGLQTEFMTICGALRGRIGETAAAI